MMRPMHYEFRENFVSQAGAKKDATALGLHLEELNEKYNGQLQPKNLVAEAKNPKSPLHRYFEWSDTKAAKAYRLQQARLLIRAVVAIYEPEEGSKVPMRIQAYTHIPLAEVSHYQPTHQALSETKTRALILSQAWREQESWVARYQHLKEFSDVVQAVKRSRKKLKLVK